VRGWRPPIFLSDTAVRNLLNVPDALTAVHKAFVDLHHGTARTPEPPMYWLKHSDGVMGSFFSKACYLEEEGVFGFRAVGTTKDLETLQYLSGSTRFITLVDARHGHPLAVIDEHYAYAVRTGAAAVVAAQSLAAPNASQVALIGAGRMQGPTLEGLAHAFNLSEVRVYARRPDPREAFASTYSEQIGVPVVPVASVGEACEGAEIIITATTADAPLVMQDDVAPGCFIYAMGLAQELDDAVVLGADKLFVDQWDLCLKMSDVSRLVAQNKISRDTIDGELPAVIAGALPGRSSEHEVIIVRSEGLVAHDIAIAHHVYQRARELGIGLVLE